MSYQVYVKIPVTQRVDREWRPVSRRFGEEREARAWARDLAGWFRQDMEVRRVRL